MWLKNDVAKVRGFSETCNTKNLGFLQKKIPNVCETLGIFFVVQGGFEPPQTEPKPVVLPLHHWTIALVSGCKGSGFLGHYQIFYRLFHDKQVIILLTLLSQQVLSVNQIVDSDGTILVSQLLFVQ